MTHTSSKKKLIRHLVMVIAVLVYSKKGDAQICYDFFEPNDSRPQAAEIAPLEVYQGSISTALDVDWFRFTLSGPQPNVMVRLFNLPANYNIFLYNPANVKIGLSKNKNADADTIIANGLSSGTYYLKIRGKAGKYNPSSCYSLKVETSAAPFRESSVDQDLVIEDAHFELYPNPATDHIILQCDEEISSVVVSIYNLMGQKISETNAVMGEGANTAVDVKDLDAGEYFLRIRCGKRTEVKKFMVIK